MGYYTRAGPARAAREVSIAWQYTSFPSWEPRVQIPHFAPPESHLRQPARGRGVMEHGEARIVVRHMDDEEERAVGDLLLDAGLDLVAVNTSLSLEGERHNNVGEIDLLFRHGDTALIIEVSVKKKRGRKVADFFDVFSDKANLDKLKVDHGEIANVRNFKRIYFDRTHDYNENELGQIMDYVGKDGNHIVYKNEFDKIKGWIESEKKRGVGSFLEIVSRKGSSPISFTSAPSA